MKKLISTVLVLIMIISLSSAAFADGGEAGTEQYDLQNIGIKITLPLKYSVITAETPEEADDLEQLALNKEMAENMLAYYGAELFMSSYELRSELIIKSMENPDDAGIKSLDDLSKVELEKITENMLKRYEKNGFIPAGSMCFETEQASFIKLFYGERNQDGYVDMVEYLTIHNGQTLSFTFFSYEKMVDRELESIYDDMIKTVVFEKEDIG